MNQLRCRFGAKIYHSRTFVKHYFRNPSKYRGFRGKFFGFGSDMGLHHDA